MVMDTKERCNKMVMDTKERSNKMYEVDSFLNVMFFLCEQEPHFYISWIT